MKKLVPELVLALSFPVSVLAQNSNSSVHPEFYAFTAPIVSNTQYYFSPNASPACFGVFQPGQQPPANCNRTAVSGNNTGFGLDLLLRHGLGVETEVAYAGPGWSFNGNGAVGVGSVDASYHFLGAKSRKRLDPFAAGGYSLYFGQRTTFGSGTNLGAGTNFWVLKHVALRSEIRFQGGIDTFDGFSQLTHYVAFRFGIAFR